MAHFPREGDGGTQRLGKGMWWWLCPIPRCVRVLAVDAADLGMLVGGMWGLWVSGGPLYWLLPSWEPRETPPIPECCQGKIPRWKNSTCARTFR